MVGLESVAITEIRPNPENARHHARRSIEAIRRSLKRFGQQRPIVIDRQGMILAGHGTHEAAKLLRWKSIAVIRSRLIGRQAIAYLISDNRIGDLSEWDARELRAQIDLLRAADQEIADDMGFAVHELAALLYDPATMQPDPITLPSTILALLRYRMPVDQYDSIMRWLGDTPPANYADTIIQAIRRP